MLRMLCNGFVTEAVMFVNKFRNIFSCIFICMLDNKQDTVKYCGSQELYKGMICRSVKEASSALPPKDQLGLSTGVVCECAEEHCPSLFLLWSFLHSNKECS